MCQSQKCPPQSDKKLERSIAALAVTCNRYHTGQRDQSGWIFQVNGRRRLVLAAAIAQAELDQQLAKEETPENQPPEEQPAASKPEYGDILARLAIRVFDGVFRDHREQTAATLVMCLLADLELDCQPAQAGYRTELHQAVAACDVKEVARLLDQLILPQQQVPQGPGEAPGAAESAPGEPSAPHNGGYVQASTS